MVGNSNPSVKVSFLFQVTTVKDGIFEVQSESQPENPDATYIVDEWNGTCTCPAYTFGNGQTCKHQRAVRQKESVRLSLAPSVGTLCPRCQTHSVTSGPLCGFCLINECF